MAIRREVLTLACALLSAAGWAVAQQSPEASGRPEAAETKRDGASSSAGNPDVLSHSLPAVSLTPLLLKPPPVEPIRPAPAANGKADTAFQWREATSQGFRFLLIQHGFRFLTEPGTRAELRGPFFRDYRRSLSDLDHWNDGDEFLVNYIGHPMMGAVTGYIQRQNDPRYRAEMFRMTSSYWRSVVRSMAYSAVYSTQFEIGPLSEASLGNVGKIRGTQGFVDLVITPTVGTGWMIGEDAIDRFLIRRIENATTNRWLKLAFRAGLNPSRAMANLMRGRTPWYRDDRGGLFGPPSAPAPAAGGR